MTIMDTDSHKLALILDERAKRIEAIKAADRRDFWADKLDWFMGMAVAAMVVGPFIAAALI